MVGRISKDYDSGGIYLLNAVRNGFDKRAITLLALADFFLGPLALGDVARNGRGLPDPEWERC